MSTLTVSPPPFQSCLRAAELRAIVDRLATFLETAHKNLTAAQLLYESEGFAKYAHSHHGELLAVDVHRKEIKASLDDLVEAMRSLEIGMSVEDEIKRAAYCAEALGDTLSDAGLAIEETLEAK